MTPAGSQLIFRSLESIYFQGFSIFRGGQAKRTIILGVPQKWHEVYKVAGFSNLNHYLLRFIVLEAE